MAMLATVLCVCDGRQIGREELHGGSDHRLIGDRSTAAEGKKRSVTNM